MNKEKLLKYMKDIIKSTKKINYTNSDFDKNILNLLTDFSPHVLVEGSPLINCHELGQKGLRWQNTQLNSKLKNNKYIIDNLSLGTVDIWMYFNGYVLSLAYSFAPTYAVIEGDNNNVWS